MSYRLIDANAIAVQFPAVNYMPCIYADLDAGLDGRHYDLRDSSVIESENARLRELLQRTWDAFHDATAREFVTVKNELRELGIEV